jgi:hypothetical protein
MSPSAALLAPLRSVRRSRVEGRNQSAPLTNAPFASPREAQSSGPQCEGGWADARGFTIAFDIVRLLQGQDWPRSSARPSVRSSRKRASHSTDGSCCRKSLPVQQVALGPGRLPPERRSISPQRAEELAHVVDEQGRLFEGGEMTAFRHLGPVPFSHFSAINRVDR